MCYDSHPNHLVSNRGNCDEKNSANTSSTGQKAVMNLAFLTDIIILLTAAVILVPVSRLVGLGIVPGFIIAGVVVGPSALGLISNQSEIAHLAELGVVLLLFLVGIELKPSRLWLMRRMVFGLGALQVIVTGAAITAGVHFLFGVGLQSALLIGPTLALSSTAFVLQLLNEQKMFSSQYGRTSVAVLLFQDLAVVPLLALVSLLAAGDFSLEADVGLALLEALVIITLILLGGRYLLQPVLHRVARLDSPEIFTATAVLLVLGTAVLMAHIGLSMAMGAFVAGLLIAGSEYRHQVVAEIQPFRGLLLGLFFISMGMSLSLDLLIAEPLMAIGLTVLLILTKAVLLWPLVKLFGDKGGAPLGVALLLAQSGEFALILFAVAFNSALLGEELFQQLLLVVVLSMLATPLLAYSAHRLVTSGRNSQKREITNEKAEKPVSIIIAGFGRVGRRVGDILERLGIAYVVIDHDAELVERERRAGRSMYFGDARQTEVFRSLGAAEADLVIVTVSEQGVAEQVVSLLKGAFPQLDILARGHNMEHCQVLRERGAWLAVSENLEASIALAQAALEKLVKDGQHSKEVIDHYRDTYYVDVEGVTEVK
jgi:monovalent cation:proton antiporter-2 (CPA2) family protein